jgi:hypothetical protein
VILRILFPFIALAIAGLSIAVDLHPRTADSRLCLSGGCRFDQILASGATPETVSALVNEYPEDPGIWCTYGEFWAAHGDITKAKAGFDRALVLGAGLSPVLVRIANFDFTHDRRDEGLRLVPRILAESDQFDELVFSYVQASGVAAPKLLGVVIPATPRAAHSWLRWQMRAGTDQDVLDTWTWMRKNQFADEKSAVEIATTLWQHKTYRDAQELWADWLGAKRGDYLYPQLLANARFQETPSGTPFDWNLTSRAGCEFIRRDGLEVHFLGQENVASTGLEQITSVEPGRYRFSAEASGDNITTDEGPFFQISDAENGARLNLETQPMLGNRSRAWTSMDFAVPAGTHIVRIGLMRRPSLKFDNKIAGTLHIYQISLVPASKT